MDQHNVSDQPQLKPLVNLTGSAKVGAVGQSIGLLDIGVSQDAYFFRVAMPGIRKNESRLKCNIKHDGTVTIQGVITPSRGLSKDSSAVFRMIAQQLGPPGPFSISFKLPGPVDPRLFSPIFRADGILEVVVLQHRARRS